MSFRKKFIITSISVIFLDYPRGSLSHILYQLSKSIIIALRHTRDDKTIRNYHRKAGFEPICQRSNRVVGFPIDSVRVRKRVVCDTTYATR